MAIIAAELIARVAVQGAKEAAGELTAVGGAAEKAGAILGIALAAGAVAVGAALYLSVRAAADFQQGLNRLITGAGDVTDNMHAMGLAIQGIAADTGVLTGPLLSAMYQIISANQRGAQAENTLAVAARGSVVEQAKIVDVAKALTTAMTDYGTSTFNATQFMNGYTRAVQLGKITLEELAFTMGPLLPIAKNLGISFSDVAAAMSTMTNAGIPAERAATSLRFLFQSLENPTKKATTAMTEFGLNSITVGNELRTSLPGALQMVYDAAKRAGPEGSVPFNRAISDMIGGQRSLQAYLALTGVHFAAFVTNSKAVTDAMNASKTAVLGWDVAQSNFNVKLAQFWAVVQNVAIALGTNLLPFLGKLLDVIRPLVSAFASWAQSSSGLAGILSQIGAALAWVFPAAQQMKPLTDAFDRASGIFRTTNQALAPLVDTLFKVQMQAKPMLDTFDRATGVFKQTTIALNPFIPILIWVRDAFLWVRDACIAVYNFMVPIVKIVLDWLTPLFKALGLMIQTILIPAWLGFVQAIKPYLPALLDLAKVLGVVLVAAFIIVIGVIVGVIIMIGLLVAAFLWIATTIAKVAQWVQTAIQNIVGFFKWLWQQLVGGSIIPELVTAILMWFGKLQTAGQALIQSFVNWIVSTWKNLVAQAPSWGQSLINGFLQGLQIAWNAVVAWVLGALAWLASKFPHSPVADGPLKGSEMWGYNFGMNIAQGLTASTGAVQSALGRMLGFMGGGGSFNLGVSGSIGMRGPLPPSMAGGAGSPIIVYVMPPSLYLDSRQMAQAVGPQLAREIQVQTGYRRPA